jgi:hypothetical protein
VRSTHHKHSLWTKLISMQDFERFSCVFVSGREYHGMALVE